jgi:hypothetical protein
MILDLFLNQIMFLLFVNVVFRLIIVFDIVVTINF